MSQQADSAIPYKQMLGLGMGIIKAFSQSPRPVRMPWRRMTHERELSLARQGATILAEKFRQANRFQRCPTR
jgi:hypothetical protein